MAEVQRTVLAGETTRRFMQFVLLQSQQAMLCLGRVPNPATGKAEVNLEAARLFIDHLEMVKEKTAGNLTKEESDILDHVLADLQVAFVEEAGSGRLA
jgi:hypothetical protein